VSAIADYAKFQPPGAEHSIEVDMSATLTTDYGSLIRYVTSYVELIKKQGSMI
jgi:hypothetical protein